MSGGGLKGSVNRNKTNLYYGKQRLPPKFSNALVSHLLNGGKLFGTHQEIRGAVIRLEFILGNTLIRFPAESSMRRLIPLISVFLKMKLEQSAG